MPVCRECAVTFRKAAEKLDETIKRTEAQPAKDFHQYCKDDVIYALRVLLSYYEVIADKNGDEAILDADDVREFCSSELAFQTDSVPATGKEQVYLATNGVFYVLRPMGGKVESLERYHGGWEVAS
jgi:hypothetical protein